jgi:hypothetical protein
MVRYSMQIFTDVFEVHDESRRKINPENAFYYSIQKVLSCLVSKMLKIRIYKAVILPVVLCGCEM